MFSLMTKVPSWGRSVSSRAMSASACAIASTAVRSILSCHHTPHSPSFARLVQIGMQSLLAKVSVRTSIDDGPAHSPSSPLLMLLPLDNGFGEPFLLIREVSCKPLIWRPSTCATSGGNHSLGAVSAGLHP